MKVPDDQIPEDMNWADYFDALSSEKFLRPTNERRPPKRIGHDPDSAAHEKPAAENDRPKPEATDAPDTH